MDYQNRFRETLNRKAEFGTPTDATKEGDSNLADLEKELGDFKTCVDSIGTPSTQSATGQRSDDFAPGIKRRLSTAKTNVQGQRGVEAQQLSKQINNYAQRFEALLNQEKELTQQSSGSVVMESPDGSEVPIIRYQEQAMISESDVRERERDAAELIELERDILDLHAIQKDLEAHVNKAGDKVTHAKGKLADAVALKSSKRKLICAIALCVGIPLVVILLVIIIVLAVVFSN